MDDARDGQRGQWQGRKKVRQGRGERSEGNVTVGWVEGWRESGRTLENLVRTASSLQLLPAPPAVPKVLFWLKTGQPGPVLGPF